MRLLHTSDWHLGRSFHGVGLLEAQRRFIDAMVHTVRTEQVDVVLIAGDVYDRALPGVDVVNLLDEALVGITAAGAQVVLTSGNHDSAVRLGFAGKLLARGGVHLRTRVADLDLPVLLPVGDGQLAIYGLPYLEPRLVADELGVETPGHSAVTEAALDRVRLDLEDRRRAGTVHSVVMAHTFASGGAGSDSERDLSIGGLGAVPLSLFEDFDYTALGHLHGRQQLSGTVRYSGSPLPYSFSEARQHKGGWILDFGPAGLVSVSAVDWPAERRLAVLRGRLAELLEDPAHAWAEEAYCQITLTDPQRPAQAMDKVRERFPDTVVLAFDPEGRSEEQRLSYSDRLAAAKDDLEVCCGFFDHVRGRAVDSEEKAALTAALDAARAAEVQR